MEGWWTKRMQDKNKRKDFHYISFIFLLILNYVNVFIQKFKWNLLKIYNGLLLPTFGFQIFNLAFKKNHSLSQINLSMSDFYYFLPNPTPHLLSRAPLSPRPWLPVALVGTLPLPQFPCPIKRGPPCQPGAGGHSPRPRFLYPGASPAPRVHLGRRPGPSLLPCS